MALETYLFFSIKKMRLNLSKAYTFLLDLDAALAAAEGSSPC